MFFPLKPIKATRLPLCKIIFDNKTILLLVKLFSCIFVCTTVQITRAKCAGGCPLCIICMCIHICVCLCVVGTGPFLGMRPLHDDAAVLSLIEAYSSGCACHSLQFVIVRAFSAITSSIHRFIVRSVAVP